MIASQDPYNSLIPTEVDGEVRFQDIIEGTTYREKTDEQTGYIEKVVVQSPDRSLIPTVVIETEDSQREYKMPVGARIQVEEGETVQAGQTLAKIPLQEAQTSDITGGLPRVEELFEARSPDEPAVVSEIDGIVSFGDRKRGSQEVIISSRAGEMEKSYMVSHSKHLLVHEGDYVEAGDRLSDGQIALRDILSIKGPRAMQEYLLNEIQEVFRLQGIDIDEKHVEILIRQMMRRVEITEPGDVHFLEGDRVERQKMVGKNADLCDKFVVTDPSDADVEIGEVITRRELREMNSELKREGKPEVEVREARPAVGEPVLLGITEAACETRSWISAAAFQKTSNVLVEAAIEAKTDPLRGFTENPVVGRSN